MRHTYRAYKVWHDTRHYIHKDSTKENVIWTENINEAKVCPLWREAVNFFFEELGFDIGAAHSDCLRLSFTKDGFTN